MTRPSSFIPGRRRALQVVGLASLASVGAWSVAAGSAAAAKERTIKVVARKFEFVPAEIRVAKGETIVLQFTAPEVPMGFNLADFQARVDIVPGRTAMLRLTPDKAGTFTFLCDVFCGSGHEDMSGTLVVT